MHVAAYLKVLQKQELSAPTIKQHLAALRMLFDWLVVGQVIPLDPDVSYGAVLIRTTSAAG